MKKPHLLVCLAVTVSISCLVVSTPTSTTVPSSTHDTRISSITPGPFPTKPDIPSATVIPTSTVHPQTKQRLIDVDKLLPPGGMPLYNQAWLGDGASDHSLGGAFLPYRLQNGVSLLAVDQPRMEDGSWNGEQIRIWDWQDTGMEPPFWKDIRPLGPGQSSFLGLDSDGHWWAVMTRLNLELRMLVVLGVFRVPDLDDAQVENLGLFPLDAMEDLQIEKIGLYPEGRQDPEPEYFVFRENNRLLLYQLKNGQTNEVWSTDRVNPGRFHIHSLTSRSGSLDMTGDGQQEVLIVWDLNLPPLIDAYQVGDDSTDILRWLGRFDSKWQYTDATGDGIPDFLYPDDPDNPKEWQIKTWNGSEFVDGTIPIPQPASPAPMNVSEPGELPSIPSSIVFRKGGSNEWWRWPDDNGSLELMNRPPSHLSDNCSPREFGGYGDACYSPAGRFKLIDIPGAIEGSSTGILDGVTDRPVTIPNSFVYTEGYNTFGWSPDEKFLLFAHGDGLARLTKINPVSGVDTTVLSTSFCGLDIWDCRNYAVLLAITDPVVFDDGGLGFAVQSGYPPLYPPPGIYRMSGGDGLTLVTSLPYIDESKGLSSNKSPHAPFYGYLLWSPDKSTYLYYDFFIGDKEGFRVLILGKSDGSALWDLRNVFPDVNEFRWE